MKFLKFFVFSFLLLFFLNCKISYASDLIEKFPEPPTVSGKSDYILYYFPSGNDYVYRLLAFEADYLYYDDDEDRFMFSENEIYSVRFSLTDGIWVYDDSWDENIFNDMVNFSHYNCTILYSTVNIYNKSDDSPFFIRTPMSTTIYSRVSGGQIVTTILTVLLGLVRYLIPLVICVIGFYKGYRLLKTVLLT